MGHTGDRINAENAKIGGQMLEKTKRCRHCQIDKPFADFIGGRKGHNECRECEVDRRLGAVNITGKVSKKKPKPKAKTSCLAKKDKKVHSKTMCTQCHKFRPSDSFRPDPLGKSKKLYCEICVTKRKSRKPIKKYKKDN